MKGFKVIKIRTLGDVEAADMSFLLEDYLFEDMENCYIDIGDPIRYDSIRKEKLSFITVVHGRLYVEQARIDVDADGNYYISEAEYQRHI